MPSSGDDENIDEALRESFPASDPPANTGETGVRIGRIASAGGPVIVNDASGQRFTIAIDGVTASLQYQQGPDATTLVHTEVPAPLGGRGLGGQLARAALDWARAQGKPVRIVCPFVREYVKKHPELLERHISSRPALD
jgi:predicted GNAT family acetyltransferase